MIIILTHKLIHTYIMSQHHTSGRQGQGPKRRSYNNKGAGNNRPRRDGSSYNSRMPRAPKKETKLSLWQRILKAVGLYKPAQNLATLPDQGKKNARTNTRIANGEPRERRSAPYSQAPTSSARLYVGNLSYEAAESDLEDLFKGVGDVKSVEVIYNPRTHKSKGYAFVEMRQFDDAVRSVEVLHDQPFMGRNITVSAANERQEGEERNYERRDNRDRDSRRNSYDDKRNEQAPSNPGLDPDDI